MRQIAGRAPKAPPSSIADVRYIETARLVCAALLLALIALAARIAVLW
jgi:hypothetical protein